MTHKGSRPKGRVKNGLGTRLHLPEGLQDSVSRDPTKYTEARSSTPYLPSRNRVHPFLTKKYHTRTQSTRPDTEVKGTVQKNDTLPL